LQPTQPSSPACEKFARASDDADILDDLKKIADLWFEFAAALEKARLSDQVAKKAPDA